MGFDDDAKFSKSGLSLGKLCGQTAAAEEQELEKLRAVTRAFAEQLQKNLLSNRAPPLDVVVGMLKGLGCACNATVLLLLSQHAGAVPLILLGPQMLVLCGGRHEAFFPSR